MSSSTLHISRRLWWITIGLSLPESLLETCTAACLFTPRVLVCFCVCVCVCVCVRTPHVCVCVCDAQFFQIMLKLRGSTMMRPNHEFCCSVALCVCVCVCVCVCSVLWAPMPGVGGSGGGRRHQPLAHNPPVLLTRVKEDYSPGRCATGSAGMLWLGAGDADPLPSTAHPWLQRNGRTGCPGSCRIL